MKNFLKWQKGKFLFILILTFFTWNLNQVYSAGLVPCGGYQEDGKTLEPVCTICHLILGIYKLIEWIRNMVLIVGLFIITLAGFMWAVSAGGSMATMAKNAISSTFFAIIVMFTAWLIIYFVLGLISSKEGDVNGTSASNPNKLLVQSGWNYKCSDDAVIGGEGSGKEEPKKSSEVECGENGTCVKGKVPVKYTGDYYWCFSEDSKNSIQCPFKTKKAKCGPASGKITTEIPSNETLCDEGNVKDFYRRNNKWIWVCSYEDKGWKSEVRCSTSSGGNGGDIEKLYSFDTGIKKQIPDASDELTNFLECMAEKLPNGARNISSISDGNGGVSCYEDHSTWKQCTSNGQKNCCYHAKNSCHYGGSCKGSSYAADINRLGYSSDIESAAKACGGSSLKESTHVHVSIGKQSGCNCDNRL